MQPIGEQMDLFCYVPIYSKHGTELIYKEVLKIKTQSPQCCMWCGLENNTYLIFFFFQELIIICIILN